MSSVAIRSLGCSESNWIVSNRIQSFSSSINRPALVTSVICRSTQTLQCYLVLSLPVSATNSCMRLFVSHRHLPPDYVSGTWAAKYPLTALTYFCKKLRYRRGTARCVVSVEILPIATQQCRNYLYDKSWTKYQLSLIDTCDKMVL